MVKVVFTCQCHRNIVDLPKEMKISDAIKTFTHNNCVCEPEWVVEGISATEGHPIWNVTLGGIQAGYHKVFINKNCKLVYDEECERKRVHCSMMKV